ncbi:MAG: hypothetical protein IPQ16_11470 [Geobacteraceae bacterium]|nr:hypothetical protein [Geobacteraceae bacterium]
MSDDLWSIITLIGLSGWISSAIVFLFRAFPGRGLFDAREARVWGSVVLVSYGIWIAGMLHA